MKGRVRIMHKNEFERSRWSGGVTTELAIWPDNAVYPNGPFTWRLSTARIEADETSFTPLPGKNRILMLLEGSVRLEHKDHHKVDLKPLEQDTFEGNWETRSFGKGTDFNLIMDEYCFGELIHLSLPIGGTMNVQTQTDREFDRNYGMMAESYYCLAGTVKIQFSNGYVVQIHRGDLFSYYGYLGNEQISFKLINEDRQEASFVRAQIFY